MQKLLDAGGGNRHPCQLELPGPMTSMMAPTSPLLPQTLDPPLIGPRILNIGSLYDVNTYTRVQTNETEIKFTKLLIPPMEGHSVTCFQTRLM